MSDITQDEPFSALDSIKKSKWEITLAKAWQLRMGVFGLCVFLVLVFCAIFAPLIAPHDPYKQDVRARLKPPSWDMKIQDQKKGLHKKYFLGTDRLGRDMLSRIIYGARTSLRIAIFAVFISAFIGVTVGLIAGYWGGWLDSVLMFFVNAILSFPAILLYLLIVSVFSPSLWIIIMTFGITGWGGFARIVRVETMRFREQEYILAAVSLAFSRTRILLKHILPNVIPSVLVLASVLMSRTIIAESLLAFLGLGVKPPIASWGKMLAEGRDYIMFDTWFATFPGIAIFFAALSINLVGDALRDLLDPHLRKS